MESIVNRMGHRFIRGSTKNCDVYLAFVRKDKRIDLPTIVRIDGIYYDLESNYEMRNKEISVSHSICEGIIYQSNFSKMMCERWLSPARSDSKKKVVYNGIELNPVKNFNNKDIDIVVAAKWRRHKRLKEIIDLFITFNKLYPSSTLHILGNLHENKKVNHKKIIYYGMVSFDDVLRVMSRANFTLHLSKRDSCPNSVIESISLGVPVITTSNCGGATEVCSITKGCYICDGDGDFNNTDLCKPYSEEWNILSDTTKKQIINSMVDIIENNVRANPPHEISIEYCTEQYIALMKEIV